jgi:hypothetical protein
VIGGGTEAVLTSPACGTGAGCLAPAAGVAAAAGGALLTAHGTAVTANTLNNIFRKGNQGQSSGGTGRAGKQGRLRELSTDPKVSNADKGWIKQDIKQIERGKRKSIRNPPGKDLAHERGRETAKGFSYRHSHLQDRSLHRTQHKYDDHGKKNKIRPLKPGEQQ